MKFKTNDLKIGVIGLGYVGLPLAHAFAEKYSVIGYDLNADRIEELEEELIQVIWDIYNLVVVLMLQMHT